MSDEPINATLERRITAAFGAEIASADRDADTAAEAEREKALDPLASPDAAKAREAMQAAEFARDRLRTVQPRLQERHKQITAQEHLSEWRSKYEKLKEVRDALAAELGEIYPAFEMKITNLFDRIAENDDELSRLHRARPAGIGLHLRSAELQARGMEEFTRYQPSIAAKLKLPTFEPGEGLAWPPPQPVSLVPVAPVGDPRLYSDRWWEPIKEEAQAAAERAEREEREREAKALENYHGPRWWEGGRALGILR